MLGLTRAQFELPPIHTLSDVIEYMEPRTNPEYLVYIPYLSRRMSTRDSADMRDHYINKIVFSTCPNTTDFTAMAIAGEYCGLSFCRSVETRDGPALLPTTAVWRNFMMLYTLIGNSTLN